LGADHASVRSMARVLGRLREQPSTGKRGG
jgi:hypothetical protein